MRDETNPLSSGPDFERLRQLSADGRLYFDYGSMLDSTANASGYRISAKILSMAFAPDASLSFLPGPDPRKGGVLSLGDMPGACIDGGLFAVEDWTEPDAMARVHAGDRVRVSLLLLVPDEGTGICQEMVAQTYVTASPEGFAQPDGESLRLCRQWRESHGLRAIDLDAAARGEPNGFGHEPTGIFTYGTLCRGECRERVMRTGPLIDVAMAELHGMSLWRHSGGKYPCLVAPNAAEEQARPVAGELWSYQADGRNGESYSKLFRRLDAIESDERPLPRGIAEVAIAKRAQGLSVDEASAATHSHVEAVKATSLFRRNLVRVHSGGRQSLAWTYFYTGPKAGLLPIVSGNWRKYVGRWDGFLLRLAASYVEKAGGLEAFCSRANASLSSLADIADAADLARRLDSGQTEERELIMKMRLTKPVD